MIAIRLRIIGALGLTAGILQAVGYTSVAGWVLVALNLVALTTPKKV